MDVKTTLKKQESQSDIDLICQHNVELMWLSHRLAMPNYKEEEMKMIKFVGFERIGERFRKENAHLKKENAHLKKENAHLKKEVRRLLAMSSMLRVAEAIGGMDE